MEVSDTNDSHSLCYGRMHENPELLIWGVSLEKKITLLGKNNLFLKTRWLLEVKETFKASGLEALKKSFLLTKKKKKNSFGGAWLPEIENVEWGGDSGGKSELSLRVAEGGKKQVQVSGRAERLLLIDEGVKGWWGWSWKSSARVGGLWGSQGGQIGIIIV